MIKKYEIKDSDTIFTYFMDTILWIQKNGRAKIPKCNYDDNDATNKLIYDFLNSGISLLEEAYTDSVFNIILQSLFFEKYAESNNIVERNTLVLISNLVRFAYYDDFLSLMKTSNLWSDKAKQYGYINIYPELDEESKKLFNDFI
jgi:hypothetical protein